MSENVVIILVAALLIVTVLFAAVIIYLFNKVLKEKPHGRHEQEDAPPLKKYRATEDHASYCVNHPQDHAHGMCAICQELFCEDCLKEHDGHTFCAPHFKLFISHEWEELESIKTTPTTPETAYPIYDFKKELWDDGGEPTVISTHYKINIDDDSIESYVKLLVIKDEFEELKGRYQKFKQ